MARHRSLIESQASLSQIEDFQESQKLEDERFEAEILKDFPDLTLEDIRACLAFAAAPEWRIKNFVT